MTNVKEDSAEGLKWINSERIAVTYNGPTVSIILATFNGEKYIGELLESLRRQTLPPTELIVSDDGSSDNTVHIVKAFAARCNFPVGLRRVNGLGSSENFLSAAKYCSGEWVVFCDQDDVWCDDRLRLAIAEAQQNSNITAVFQSCALCNADLMPMSPSPFPGTHAAKAYRSNTISLPHVWPGFLQVLSRLVVNVAASTRRPRQLHYAQGARLIAHDRWTFILASMLGDVVVQNDIVAKFRRHSDAQTGFYDGRRHGLWHLRSIAGIRLERTKELYTHLLAVRSVLTSEEMKRALPDESPLREAAQRYYCWALESKITSMILGDARGARIFFWLSVGVMYAWRSKRPYFYKVVLTSSALRVCSS